MGRMSDCVKFLSEDAKLGPLMGLDLAPIAARLLCEPIWDGSP